MEGWPRNDVKSWGGRGGTWGGWGGTRGGQGCTRDGRGGTRGGTVGGILDLAISIRINKYTVR